MNTPGPTLVGEKSTDNALAAQYLKPGDWIDHNVGASGARKGATKFSYWNGTNWVGTQKRPPGDEVKATYSSAEKGYVGYSYEDPDAETGPAYSARVAQELNDATINRIKPLAGPDENYSSDNVLRYPGGEDIGASTDYVLFQFKRYAPPFKNRPKRSLTNEKIEDLSAWAKGAYDYNQGDEYKDANHENFPTIAMYMPEDVSTGFRGNWGGKAFSTVGANMLASAGQEGLDQKLQAGIATLGEAAERSMGLLAAAALRKSIQSITGDTLSNDDVFGSISGAIMNPNTELLFQSVDMRNFMLKFKLVPRNDTESKTINRIVKTFKACTLPMRDPGKVFGFNKSGDNSGIISGFIGVPHLCKVSFMRGTAVHNVLPIYKMLAVTQVDVNYTPDGAYATYGDGQPVAIELAINFQETKINFAEEVLRDSIR